MQGRPIKPDLVKYDAVVFDLFHTLIGLDSIYTPGSNAWDYLGISEKDWREALFSDVEGRLRGRITDPNEVLRDIVCKLLPDVHRDETEHASRIRTGQFEAALANFRPHVLETVAAIRSQGKRLGLVSNADAIEIASWPRSLLAACFDSAVFSCAVGYIKPEREIYLSVLADLGVPAGRCLFVGDGGNDELAGARRAGMDAAITLEFIQEPDSEVIKDRRAQANFEITRISELLP